MRSRSVRRVLACLCAVLPATRLSAQTQLPATVYIYPMGNFAQNAMMSSLAGVVNRSTSGEVLLSPDNGAQPNPRFWLDQLKLKYPQVQSQVQSQPLWYLTHYRSQLSGYVLYDAAANPDSLNIATSIAGVTNSIIVDSSTQINAQLAGLPQTADARAMTYAQAYSTYGPQFNKDMLFHQATYFDNQLRDFAIMNRGFVYYSSPTALNPYAANQNHQGRIFGWADSEFDMFNQASQNNQQVVASNYSWSTSTTAKWKVPVARQTYHTPGNVATSTGKHYVAFVMSDGDNAQWLTNGFATDPKWFGSPYRGRFNMTWDFTPTLAEMNPVAHNYLYEHASTGSFNDNFVAAGGAGTIFPSQYPDIAGLAASIGQSMAAADLRVTSILDPAYNLSKLYPILDQDQVTGMMFKAYANYYRGRNGAIDWHNGKPIMSVKYSLWDGADTAKSLAAALNASTHRDAVDDSLSYDIVNVHPWSTSGPDGTGSGDPMSNLNQLVQWLDPTKVQVVTLEELMVQLRNHFGTPVAGAVINATWTRNASSNWGTRTNWTGAMPNFIDATVNFAGAITAARTVTVDIPVRAGHINFNSAFGYTLAGASTVTLDVGNGQATINVVSASHTISAPLALADDTLITVAPASGTLTITNLQPTSSRITKAGAGLLVVNNIRAAGLTISDGTLRLTADGAASGVSIIDTLSIAPNAALDLTNNDLVVNAARYSDIQALVRQGFSGTSAITSSTSDGSQILALFDNALVGAPSWAGRPIGGNAVVGKYTYFGDMDFDGQVTADDYGILDANLGTTPPPGIAWLRGDADLDGSVTADDYGILDANLGAGAGNPLSPHVSAIPEPVAVLAILLTALALGRRRTIFVAG